MLILEKAGASPIYNDKTHALDDVVDERLELD